MNSLLIPLRCPQCAAKVKPVNIGEPVDGGTNVNAVLRCTRRFCRHEFSVHVFIMSMGTYNEDGEAHGTAKAFHRHKEAGEQLCDDCRDYNTRKNADTLAARMANA